MKKQQQPFVLIIFRLESWKNTSYCAEPRTDVIIRTIDVIPDQVLSSLQLVYVCRINCFILNKNRLDIARIQWRTAIKWQKNCKFLISLPTFCGLGINYKKMGKKWNIQNEPKKIFFSHRIFESTPNDIYNAHVVFDTLEISLKIFTYTHIQFY